VARYKPYDYDQLQMIFAYSRGILHSRRMERACRENVTFMALACGQAPDHSTLASFVSSMGEERIVRLFTQVLLVCEQEGLLGGTQFILDGFRPPVWLQLVTQRPGSPQSLPSG